MHARDISSLLSAAYRVEAQQCETAELAEARQEALWKSLHDAIVEVEAAGLERNVLSVESSAVGVVMPNAQVMAVDHEGVEGDIGLQCLEVQAGALVELKQAKQARDITGLRFAISIADAMQCEAAEVALSYQCRVRMYEFLRNIIDEADAAGLGDEDGELSTRRVILSALLSMPSISAKAMLAHMVAQQRALVAGMRAECGLPAG